MQAVASRRSGEPAEVLRAGVAAAGTDSGGRIASLVDVGPKTVALVYNFRRYQQTSVAWGLAAAGRGAHLIVVTDHFLSPLAPHATSLLTADTGGIGPFDSMASGSALTEVLIAEVARNLGEPARQRLQQFERLQIEEETLRGGSA